MRIKSGARFGIALIVAQLIPLMVTQCQEEGGAESMVSDRLLIEQESQIDPEAMEDLAAATEQPIDLLQAGDDELRRLPLIPAAVLDRLIDWRNAGRIRSYAELRSIEGMTPKLIQLLKVMTFLDDARSDKNGKLRLRTRTIIEEEDLKEYAHRYNIAQKSDHRLTLSRGSARDGIAWNGALRIEKDAGERRWNDLVSGFFSVADGKSGFHVVAGTYRVGHGEGILLRRTRPLSAGDDSPGDLVRQSAGLRGSSSSDVRSMLRGVAAGWSTQDVAVDVFFSEKPLHASVNDSGIITSMYGSDLFRTESEERKRNMARERVIGLRTEATIVSDWRAGIAVVYCAINKEMESSMGPRTVGGISLGVTYGRGGSRMASELAMDASHQISGRLSGMTRVTDFLSLGCALRSYASQFNTRYGGGPSLKNDASQNEEGCEIAAHLQLVDGIELDCRIDRARYAERAKAFLTYANASTSRVCTSARLSPNVNMEFVVAEQRSEELLLDPTAIGGGLMMLKGSVRRSVRFVLRGTPAKYLGTTTRIDMVRVRSPRFEGVGIGTRITQDIRFKVQDVLSLVVRAAFFDADRYEARLFDVLPDLPGASGLAIHDGTGRQLSMVATIHIADGLACSAKYLQTDALPRSDGSRPTPRPVAHIEGGLQIEATIHIP